MSRTAGEFTIRPEREDDDAVVREIIARLVRYNEGHVPPEGARRLVMTVRGPGGELLGGLHGHTRWNWLFVDHLWLADELRGRGMGSELLRRAEAEGVRRGCRHAYLDTFSFQTRGFYERLGYEVFGTLDDFPPGHARYFLQNRDIDRANGTVG
jgi:GNAT superfamily N-acetyltransferase